MKRLNRCPVTQREKNVNPTQWHRIIFFTVLFSTILAQSNEHDLEQIFFSWTSSGHWRLPCAVPLSGQDFFIGVARQGPANSLGGT